MQAAEQHGVLLAPGGRFSGGGGLQASLRLPFTVDPELAVEAVGRIAAVDAQVRAGAAAGRKGTQRSPLIA
ncbi:hypothetical protein BH20ACT6_BH20ACT6_13500 [soil metagenome]